jgi:hypothetical protein
MLLQELFTVAFALACAWLNTWPVYKFMESGASKKMERDFHAANAAIKVLCSATIATSGDLYVWHIAPQVLLTLLIQWLVFDLALNFFTGKKVFYIGQTAKLDRLLVYGIKIGDHEVFNPITRLMETKDRRILALGKWAGQVKAGVCLVIIVALNLVLSKWT